MFGPGSRGALVLPVGAVAVAMVVGIAVLVIGNIQYDEQSDRLVPSELLGSIQIGLLAAGLVSLVAGFAIMRSRPAVGAVLAVGGSWVAGLMLYWLIVPLLIAVAISVYAVRRARRIAAEVSGHSVLNVVKGGNHVVNNRRYMFQTQTADWLARQFRLPTV